MAPLFPITLALIAGILLKASGISALFMIVPVLIISLLLIKHHHNAALIIAAGLVGFSIAYAHTPLPLNPIYKGITCNYSGVVKETHEYESSRMILVQIDSCNHLPTRTFIAKIFIPSSLPVLDATDRIGFTASLSDIKSQTYIPDEIDYNLPLMQQGVIADGIIEPKNVYYSYPESGILNSIFRVRIKLTRIIAKTPLTDATKNFLITALTGDRSYLQPHTRDLFSHTGLAHIIALSGLHVGIITWVITIVLLPLTLTGLRTHKIIITIILLWLFAIMTGLTPSVVRAVTMSSLYLLATLFERKHASLNSLCFAAILILLFSPFSLFNIGFQLSFFAVAAIILFSSKINPVSPKRKVLHTAVGYITVTASAMIGTGIISAYHFGIFPIYFLVTNVITSILLPFLLGGGVIIVIGQLMGLSLKWLSSAVDFLYDVILRTSQFTASLPGAYIDNINLTPPGLFIYFITLASIALLIYQRKKLWALSTTMTILSFIFIITMDRPVYSDIALYIPPSHSGTIILVKERKKFWLISTLHKIEQQDLKQELERKYHKFMSKRDIDSISILPSIYHSRFLTRKESILRTKGKTIAIINNPTHKLNFNIPIDYALITKGFSGDITSIRDIVKADTIVLSGDINLRRHNRYVSELSNAGMKFKILRDEPIIIE